MFECDQCGTEYPSHLAATQCAYEDSRQTRKPKRPTLRLRDDED